MENGATKASEILGQVSGKGIQQTFETTVARMKEACQS